ncbi:hypothetical membrane protein [Candidatus Protochlamydia naegleriophila]|uniref:Hypothetical membrane protein n=1 Tax=Candidatus Protochlamydia naegleriophila TaxID=389348 RepID=A0A0U5JHN7_9BACT|nr:hypothetical membrane protein [Candidatus Protochlamydia naegleriophila]
MQVAPYKSVQSVFLPITFCFFIRSVTLLVRYRDRLLAIESPTGSVLLSKFKILSFINL